MQDDRVPVLIGVSEVTERETDPARASSPMDLMQQAVEAAAGDAAITTDRLQALDRIAVVKSMYAPCRNPPTALARRIGADRARCWLTPIGGNMPQYAVNRFAEEIAEGRSRFVLLAGTEAMATGRQIIKSGGRPDWNEGPDEDPALLVEDRPLGTAYEKAHDIWPARYVYPLFENALRGRYGHSIDEHQLAMGRLFARFSEVAAESDKAWYPIRRSAEEIARPGPKNRIVGWPYTKYMNAMNQVNQSAAVLMTSVGEARAMGVPEDRWLYLHGCADANELWHFTDRQNYHSSPAIRALGQRALGMAGKSIDEIDFLDIYACFPSAVEMARDELGIAVDDPRPLTVTGGLPYYGGAGSYVLNAIAAMTRRLRAHPGRFGLVTANGGFLTEHAAGIYSTEPSPRPRDGDAPWRRTDPAVDQRMIDALPRPALIEAPDGEAVIETYTVGFGRDNEPDRGIVVGRLGDGRDPDAPRFIAKLPLDADLLRGMSERDHLGAPGRVTTGETHNIFTPA